ncbi:MAG: YicC/YloC family endoribonuclease [Saprospiraceae bacterium]
MLLSMTGYGRATKNSGEKTITVELRTLNSKLTDLKLRLPGDYKEKELELRKQIVNHAERGKIDLTLDIQNASGAAAVNINEQLFRGYFEAINRLSGELGTTPGDIIPTILRIPNVVSTPSSDLNDAEWQHVKDTVHEALEQLKAFRIKEGNALGKDLGQRAQNILQLLEDVKPLEAARVERMRERLQGNLEEFLGSNKIDTNRFEQEILYYLEKMDITEEKVRLKQHCEHFLTEVNNQNQASGRTMAFISQEMGREINTLGAKAYDADLQKLVVAMKDELEKIKEQLANVL